MAISNNKYKLRSSLVRYERFNELLPQRTNASRRFSDIDMFHTYNGHRLFLELKHKNAKKRYDEGVSKSIQDMFQISMERGEFCLILWGVYEDFNLNKSDYYSEFFPTEARVFNPIKQKVINYTNIDDKWIEKFFAYWYKTAEKFTPKQLGENCEF